MPLLLALLLCLPALATPVELAFGPYLQDVRHDRATVMWTTRGGPGEGAVRILLPSGPLELPSTTTLLARARTQLQEDLWLHAVPIPGLQPATSYDYSVLLDRQPAAAGPSFRLLTAGDPSFQFLVIGDSGDNGAGQRLLAQRLNLEPAAFLLHTGDIAYWTGSFLQFQQAFFEIYAPLLRHIPVFPTLGNHDTGNNADAYRTFFRPPQDNLPPDARGLYYSFDWAGVHFVVLDSNDSLQLSLEGRNSMLSWLEDDLRSTRATWRVVSLHHPPFPSTGYKLNDAVCALVRQHLTPIFERHGVHAVFSGHEHIYQHTRPRRNGDFLDIPAGSVYVTTGGAGSQYYDPSPAPFISFAAGGPHFLRVSVSPSAFRVEAVRPDGAVFDTWSLSPAPVLLPQPVRDAAAFSTQIAPGSLVSLLGWNLASRDQSAHSFPLPHSLSGSSLQADGKPWPILFAGRTQINAQAPHDLSAESTIRLSTSHGFAETHVSLSPTAPQVFRIEDQGRSIAAALHPNGRLVTAASPAAPGQWISVFATGLGNTLPAWPDGQPAPTGTLLPAVAKVRVLIAGRDAEVAAACLAPGFAGLYQINVRIPTGLPSGFHPLQILAAGTPSATVPLSLQ